MKDHMRWKDIRDARCQAENDDLSSRVEKHAEAEFADFEPEEWMGRVFDQIETVVTSASPWVDRHGDTLSCLTEHGENLSVRIRQAPFPSPPGIEARIAWSVDKNGRRESGETDVQPDDPMSHVRQHVLEELSRGLDRLRAR